jgi:hypothetical protein
LADHKSQIIILSAISFCNGKSSRYYMNKVFFKSLKEKQIAMKKSHNTPGQKQLWRHFNF